MDALGLTQPVRYRASPAFLVTVGLCVALLSATSYDTLLYMARVWTGREEYSHGFLIPIIAVFLVWQRKDQIEKSEFRGSWLGVMVVAVGVVINFVGQLATLFILQQIGLLIAVYGLVLAFAGLRVFRLLAAPLLLLLFMIPLPDFLLNTLSARLQLLSSQIGVGFIRLFDISVYLEGNVIDLGVYKLQVAEACDGLRYLFPLMTLGFIMAYFFRAALWKRLLLFLSSIPITILMNSVRVGTIAVLVEHWGTRMAEGFLHDFQGWAVFMVSATVMLLEMMLLSRIGRDRRPWRELFGLEFPAPTPKDAARVPRAVPASLYAVCGLMVTMATLSLVLPERAEAAPERGTFAEFPLTVGPWSGRKEAIEHVYLDVLQLDDYIVANYTRPGNRPVNFYAAWYDSQRAGRSAHSPRSCIPGGGWQITSLAQLQVPGVLVGQQPLEVNRVRIELGSHKQLVYYWFQQRGRVVTNEYLVKWFLFWDALTRNRTDGALVRLAVPLSGSQSDREAERQLLEFLGEIAPRLGEFVPD